MQTAFSPSTESTVVHLFIQIATILAASKFIGSIFIRVGQSRSIGEIFAGILLGPSLFGALFPETFKWIFKSITPPLLPWFSHVGLVLALFLIGMEFDFSKLRPDLNKVIPTALVSLILPLLGALILTPWLWSIMPGGGSKLAYTLFLGMIMAITAIPIMGRILMELNLTQSRLGLMAISTGALKDLITWLLLVVVVGVARPPFSGINFVYMIISTVIFIVLTLTLGRKIIFAIKHRIVPSNSQTTGSFIGVLLIFLMLLAATTAHIGVFAILGAFLAGVAVSADRPLSNHISSRFHDLTFHLFLPIFFTYTGLRCDLTLVKGSLVGALLLVTIIGTLLCGGAAFICGIIARIPVKESIAYGFLINTPGLMVLILLNIGLDLGVISNTLFAVLVGSAMLRNLMPTPSVRSLMGKT